MNGSFRAPKLQANCELEMFDWAYRTSIKDDPYQDSSDSQTIYEPRRN